MNLSSLIEIVVHYLIRRMTYLGYRNSFLIVSALVCMIIYWIGPAVNHVISYLVVIIH